MLNKVPGYLTGTKMEGKSAVNRNPSPGGVFLPRGAKIIPYRTRVTKKGGRRRARGAGLIGGSQMGPSLYLEITETMKGKWGPKDLVSREGS